MARPPASDAARFEDIRSKLNRLNYTQPLGEVSLALVEKLLEDLLKSADSYRILENDVKGHERQIDEVEDELRVLQRAQPELLRENVELHKRVLKESTEMAARRRQWAARQTANEKELRRLRSLQQLQVHQSQELQSSVERLRARMAENRKTSRDDKSGKSRTIVMRGPPPAPGARPRLVDVGRIEGPRAEGPALASHVAFVAEQLGESRRRLTEEVRSLKAAEAKEEAAAEELSRARARAAEREGPSDNPDDVTDEVKVLRDEEARAAAEAAELETECNTLRQRGLRLSTEADAAEALMAKRRGLLQHAQQQRDVAKEVATRLELGTSDPAFAGLTRELNEARRASSKTKSEEVAIREALAMLRENLEAEEARGEAEAKEHAVQQSRLLEELAAAEQSRPAQKIASLEAAHGSAVQRAAKGSSQRAGLAAELARLRAHRVVQRRLLATAEAEVEASQHAASATAAEAQMEDTQRRLLSEVLQGAQSEADALQVYLETATSERLAASEEVAAARLVESSWRSAAQARQEAQLRLSKELQSARIGASEAEAKRTETRRKEEAISSASAVLGQRLAAEQAELAEAQHSCRELSSSLARAAQELDEVRGQCQSEEASIRHLQLQMTSLGSTLRSQEASTSELAALRLELGQRQDTLREMVKEESESQASVWAARREGEAAEAHAEALQGRIKAVSDTESQMEEVLHELEAAAASRDRQRAALAERRHSFQAELAECLAEIAEEESRSAATKHGPGSVRMRLEELEEESIRLRGTISGLEADQVELVQISDSAEDRLRPLRAEAARVRTQRGEVQWTLDRLRRRVARQDGELVNSTATAAATSDVIRSVEAEVQSAQSELSERMHEVTLALDDLMHMTAENQLLHEQLKRCKTHRDRLAHALEEQDSQQLPMMQELRGHQFLRDTVLRAYQEAIDERQRKEVAVSEMSKQVENSFEEVNGLKQSLEALLHTEDVARSQLQSGDSELTVLRAKMSDATQVLEMQEFASEELRVESSRLRLAASSQQVAINEAVLSAAAVAAQADALRAEVQSLQHDLEQARGHLADGQLQRDEALKSKSKLEDLLSTQRQMQLQKEAEIHALRGTVDAAPAENGKALQQTLERLQRLKGFMGTERGIFAAEVERLSTELRSFQSASDSGH